MVNFAFGIHNHQPVDSPDNVVTEAYTRAYKPFLDILREFDGMRANFHISGGLLEWLQERQPEYLAILKELVQSHRIELLSSGMYEPILSLLPEDDRLGQILMFNERLFRAFGIKPKGAWLPGLVWEQGLVRALTQAGIEYVVLDDTHFRNAGLDEESLSGYYVTEDQGRTLAVFPMRRRLRNLIPFRDGAEIVAVLNDQAQYHGTRLVTLFDDGAELGAGTEPQTNADEAGPKNPPGGLRRFFTELSAAPNVQLTLLSDFLAEQPALGRIYLDNAASEELGEWVMTPERYRQFQKLKDSKAEELKSAGTKGFLRTGYFRNFLSRYTEANRLHKRMLWISNKLHQSRKPEEKKAPVRIELYKAQGNDAYWHGERGGGLYLPHLRQGAYRHLLRADNLLSENPGMKLTDFDACGRKEIVFDYKQLFAVINPNLGGTLLAFDDKEKEVSWLDTITRRPESYHARLVAAGGREPEPGKPPPANTDERRPGGESRVNTGEQSVARQQRVPGNGAETKESKDARAEETKGSARYLRYDRHPRYGLLDHFYKLATTVQNCRQGEAEELHEVALLPRDFELEHLKVVMTTADFLSEKPSHLYKEIILETNRVIVTYDVLANFWQPYRFAVDLSLLPLRELRLGDRTLPLDGIGEERKVEELRVTHESGAGLTIRAKKIPFTLWYYPIETVAAAGPAASGEEGSRRPTPTDADDRTPALTPDGRGNEGSGEERGIELTYQGTALVFNWEQNRPAGVFELEIAWQ